MRMVEVVIVLVALQDKMLMREVVVMEISLQHKMPVNIEVALQHKMAMRELVVLVVALLHKMLIKSVLLEVVVLQAVAQLCKHKMASLHCSAGGSQRKRCTAAQFRSYPGLLP